MPLGMRLLTLAVRIRQGHSLSMLWILQVGMLARSIMCPFVRGRSLFPAECSRASFCACGLKEFADDLNLMTESPTIC